MYSPRAILTRSNGNNKKLCRNLFGPVDHERLRADFETMLKSTAEEAKQRWNFDFVTETPLDGDYKWEKVDYASRSNAYKRKQTLITDFFQVKRQCSAIPSVKKHCA